MKYYIIRETSGYPTIMRNGQQVQIGLGEQFNEDELPSLTCAVAVTYLCIEDSSITTQQPNGTVAAPAPVVAPVEPTPVAEETPESGVVPSSMETGSETPEA